MEQRRPEVDHSPPHISLAHHAAPVASVVAHATAPLLASCAEDGGVCVWGLVRPTGAGVSASVVASCVVSPPAQVLAWSPSAAQRSGVLFAGCGAAVVVLALSEACALVVTHVLGECGDEVAALAVVAGTPPGVPILVAASDDAGCVTLFDADARRVLRVLRCHEPSLATSVLLRSATEEGASIAWGGVSGGCDHRLAVWSTTAERSAVARVPAKGAASSSGGAVDCLTSLHAAGAVSDIASARRKAVRKAARRLRRKEAAAQIAKAADVVGIDGAASSTASAVGSFLPRKERRELERQQRKAKGSGGLRKGAGTSASSEEEGSDEGSDEGGGAGPLFNPPFVHALAWGPDGGRATPAPAVTGDVLTTSVAQIVFAAALGDGTVAVYRLSAPPALTTRNHSSSLSCISPRSSSGGVLPSPRMMPLWWRQRAHSSAACAVTTVVCRRPPSAFTLDAELSGDSVDGCGVADSSCDSSGGTVPFLVSAGNDSVFCSWRWHEEGLFEEVAGSTGAPPWRTWRHVKKAGVNWLTASATCGGILAVADTSRRVTVYFDLAV